MAAISKDLVRSLLENPSPENRERSVVQLTEVFRTRALTGRAATMLEEVIRIFAHDAAQRVRKAVSEQLQHDPELPQDIALSLAGDVDDVAIPILRFSRALSDKDLADIVAREGQKKLRAIAGRERVGEELSDALIEKGDADTVGTLFANQGSAPSEVGMLRAVAKFGDDDRVQGPLARRSTLPVSVMTRMVAVVSEHVLSELSLRADVPDDLAADIMRQAEERVFVELSREESDPAELVENLEDLGRLSPNLAMRSLLSGDIGLFEHIVARLAKIDLNAVRTLAYDAGALGVKELCRKMEAPERLYDVMATGISTFASIRAEGGAFDRERFQARMVERILTNFEYLGDDLETDDVEALIRKLRVTANEVEAQSDVMRSA